MNLAEAYAAAIEGHKVTADHLQAGSYVMHRFPEGMVRCFAVESAAQEHDASRSDFRPNVFDETGNWRIFEPVYPEPAKASGWGAAPIKPARSTAAGAGGWGANAKSRPRARGAAVVEQHAAIEFCGQCDYAMTACKCAKEPSPSETSKWGLKP